MALGLPWHCRARTGAPARERLPGNGDPGAGALLPGPEMVTGACSWPSKAGLGLCFQTPKLPQRARAQTAQGLGSVVPAPKHTSGLCCRAPNLPRGAWFQTPPREDPASVSETRNCPKDRGFEPQHAGPGLWVKVPSSAWPQRPPFCPFLPPKPPTRPHPP